MKFKSAAIALCVAMFGGVSSAAEITKTFNVEFSAFEDIFSGIAPPQSVVSASFTVTFDPVLNYLDETTGIVVNHVNTPVSSAFGFTLFHFPSDLVLAIGGVNGGANLIFPGVDDFSFLVNINDIDAPRLVTCDDLGAGFGCPSGFLAAGYTRADSPESAWLAKSGVVPEPATWGLMIGGFASAGAALRRRNAIARA